VATDKLGLGNFRETNVTKLFDDCSKYCFITNTPTQAIHALQTGIQHAISLPGDVSEADASELATGERNFFPRSLTVSLKEENRGATLILETLQRGL